MCWCQSGGGDTWGCGRLFCDRMAEFKMYEIKRNLHRQQEKEPMIAYVCYCGRLAKHRLVETQPFSESPPVPGMERQAMICEVHYNKIMHISTPFGESPADKAVAESEKPRFENGLIIAAAAMVVDKHGVNWWVDPVARLMKRAAPNERGVAL